MSESIIRAEHLSRYFGAVKAVDDLSLEVTPGIIFGFLGPNGAGKTTTIHLLLGLLEPTSGNAWVMSFDARKQSSEIRSRSGALLASRISDRAILLGKIIMTVAFAWGMSLITLVLAGLDAILVLISLATFRRSRLILS